MKIKNILNAASSLLGAGVRKKKTPLIVSWALTTRCNLRCRYCNAWNVNGQELETRQIFSIIEELSGMGTRKLQLTGGEPLLREDIGEIVDFCNKKGIRVSINSNGLLVEKKIDSLQNLDLLCLSLDGPEPVHDYLRGPGSYRRVIQAANIARKKNIRLRFTAVLSSVNLKDIDFVLERAREFRAPVFFQPAATHLLMSAQPNPVAAPAGEYKKAISGLLAKKKKNGNIANSFDALRHLYKWPEKTKIRCLKGLVACRIETNGDVYICPRIKDGIKPRNCLKEGFRQAFYSLPVLDCASCWCAANVEINLLLAFKPGAILNAAKFI